jgi:hypothetical protein
MGFAIEKRRRPLHLPEQPVLDGRYDVRRKIERALKFPNDCRRETYEFWASLATAL